MNLNIFSIILSLIGEGLIAFIFFYVIPDNTFIQDVRILDFVVSSIVYWLWVYNALKPAVDLASKDHKQVGGLGIRWAAVTWYSILALGLILVNVILYYAEKEPMSFTLQVCLQAVFLFLFGVSLLASQRSMEKTAEIYHKEQIKKEGKANIKSALSSLVAEMEDLAGIPEEIRDRVRKVSADTRYLTPSTTPAAKEADRKVEVDCQILHASLCDYEMNKDMIERQIGKLERDMERRRQTL